jgi:hypothetical protein
MCHKLETKWKGILFFSWLLTVLQFLRLRESVSSSNDGEKKDKLEIKKDFLISSLVAFKNERYTSESSCSAVKFLYEYKVVHQLAKYI